LLKNFDRLNRVLKSTAMKMMEPEKTWVGKSWIRN